MPIYNRFVNRQTILLIKFITLNKCVCPSANIFVFSSKRKMTQTCNIRGGDANSGGFAARDTAVCFRHFKDVRCSGVVCGPERGFSPKDIEKADFLPFATGKLIFKRYLSNRGVQTRNIIKHKTEYSFKERRVFYQCQKICQRGGVI